MADAQDRWDGSEYADNSSMQYRQALEALDRIDVGSYERILDIGYDNGAVTNYISEQMPAGQIVGIDISPSMVEFAHQRYAEPGRIDFQQTSANQLEFNNAFDLVCSFSILHWVKRQWDVWSGIHRALREFRAVRGSKEKTGLLQHSSDFILPIVAEMTTIENIK